MSSEIISLRSAVNRLINENEELKKEVERLERGVKWIADQLGTYGNPANGQMWLDALLSGDAAPMDRRESDE